MAVKGIKVLAFLIKVEELINPTKKMIFWYAFF